MKPLLIAAVAALAAAPLAANAAGGLEVLRPWSRPAVAGTNGVGYLVIASHGRRAAVLEKVESAVAARVEMHASSMAGGVMSMAKVDRIEIPAGGETTFGPGGYHLMLIGLTRTLKAGDQAPVTLSFAGGARLTARLTVSAGMGPPPGAAAKP
jgi:periplasmic copper chaperone A